MFKLRVFQQKESGEDLLGFTALFVIWLGGFFFASTVVMGGDSIGPTMLFATRYDGPVGQEDKCTGIVVGHDQNVYLFGYSFGGLTDFDFAVVKADTMGKIIWSRRYGSPLGCEDRPWSAVWDGEGVVAAGGTIADLREGWDYQYVKFGQYGETCWVRRLEGISRGDDKAVAIALCPGGGFFLTGSSGKREIAEKNAERVDSAPGRILDWDILTCRCDDSGKAMWVRRYEGKNGGDEFASRLAVDKEGNCYVAGTASVGKNQAGLLLLKYNREGKLLWQRRVADEQPGAALAPELVLDNKGKVYLAGTKYRLGSSYDYLVACFSPNGKLLWSHFLDGEGSVDIIQSACVDEGGNLIVTGQSTGRGSSFDVFTVKFSYEGEIVWARRYNSSHNAADRGWTVCLDQRGGIVVGATSVGRTGQPDLLLLGYSSAGELEWSYSYSGQGVGEARPVAIYPYGEKDLLVAGYAMYPESDFDYLLLRLRLE